MSQGFQRIATISISKKSKVPLCCPCKWCIIVNDVVLLIIVFMGVYMDNSKQKKYSELSSKEKASKAVDDYVGKRHDEYINNTLYGDRNLNSGAFGTTYLFLSTSGTKYVSKESNFKDGNLEKEGEITAKLGIDGAKKRVLRRLEKGYAPDVRLSAPQVFGIAKKELDMEFMEKGDLIGKQNVLDVYDLLKQASKLVYDMHSDWYIHRDIKPGNMLMGKDNKIRLADMDSVIKVYDFSAKNWFCTPAYAKPSDHTSDKGNKFKIDIYSLAVTSIQHIVGEKKFDAILKNRVDYSMNNPEISNELLSKFIDTAQTLKDKQLGNILGKMLKGEYESLGEVLKDLSKNKTMNDKKDLKIGLSYISNNTVDNKVLLLVSERRRVLTALEKPSAYNGFRKLALRKINYKIAHILESNSKKMDSTKKDFIKKLASKFKSNDFTSNEFILTKASIKKQREKNIALESKFMKKSELPLDHKMV